LAGERQAARPLNDLQQAGGMRVVDQPAIREQGCMRPLLPHIWKGIMARRIQDLIEVKYGDCEMQCIFTERDDFHWKIELECGTCMQRLDWGTEKYTSELGEMLVLEMQMHAERMSEWSEISLQ
jgi:hypothetical protein